MDAQLVSTTEFEPHWLPCRNRLVGDWSQIVASFAASPSPGSQAAHRIEALVDQALQLVYGDHREAGAAEDIGSALASLCQATPEAAGRCLRALASQAAVDLSAADAPGVQLRLADLLGGIATGYGRAVAQNADAQHRVALAAAESARLGAERARRASEERFRQLIDLLPVGYLAVKPGSGSILMANRLALDFLGVRSHEEVLGRTAIDFLGTDQTEMARVHIARMGTPEATIRFDEERVVLPDGSAREVEFAGRLLVELDEPVVQVIFRDIGDRKAAEAALRESEALFRTLAETTASAIFMFRDQFNIYVNKAACDITGYTKDELLTMPFWQLIRPDYQALVRERGLARQRGEAVETHYEVPILARGGATRWLQFAGRLIDYQGTQAVLGMAIDITANKLAQEALRESEKKFRTLAEVSPAGILIAGDHAVHYANPGLVALTGYTSDELYHMDLAEVVAPGSIALVRAALDTLDASQPMEPIEFEIRTKTGDSKWVSASWHSIELAGEQAWMATGFDITQLTEDERKLRRYAERLELLGEIDRVGLLAHSKRDIAVEVLGLISQLIRCDRASITEIDALHHSMALLAVYPQGNTRIVEGRRFALEQWQATMANLKHGSYYVPDLGLMPHRTPLQEEIYREGIQSYLVVPLRCQNTMVGVLNLGSFQVNAYSPDVQAIAIEASQRVAMVLHNAQLFADLEASQRHLRDLSRQLVLVQEQERRFLARELHDEIAQALTALSISLDLATRTSGPRRAALLAEAQRWVQDLSTRVRQLSLDLRPPMLDDLGLLATLYWFFDRCAHQLRLSVTFDHQGLEKRLDPDVEIVVYRMVQEALTNIARHAGSNTATVRLWADTTTLSVQVEDRGRGFDAEAILERQASGGLSGMRERVRQVGGQLIVDTSPRTGTCLTALIPLGDVP